MANDTRLATMVDGMMNVMWSHKEYAVPPEQTAAKNCQRVEVWGLEDGKAVVLVERDDGTVSRELWPLDNRTDQRLADKVMRGVRELYAPNVARFIVSLRSGEPDAVPKLLKWWPELQKYLEVAEELPEARKDEPA